jgi:hypothetical protein
MASSKISIKRVEYRLCCVHIPTSNNPFFLLKIHIDAMYRGGGMYGKLGHGNEVGHSTPKRVDALVGLGVSHIACGSRHTAIITSSGAIYTWGDKENGVTGHGDTDGHQYTPKLLERLAGKR